MKKSLVALAVLAASGAAMAQSSVTLYGIADVWVGSVKAETGATSTTNTVMVGGGVNTSRWGMKGSEDLGGGLKANFNLEQGFAFDTGAAGTFLAQTSDTVKVTGFDRQAWVGFSGGFGAVKVGKTGTAFDNLSGATDAVFNSDLSPGVAPSGYSGSGVMRSFNDAAGKTGNQIHYQAPDMSGFTGAVSYALAESANSLPAGNTAITAFNLKYSGGPVFAYLAYQKEDKNNTSNDLAYTNFGATYDFGMAKAKFTYGKVDKTNATTDGATTEWTVGADVPVSAVLTLSAGYAKSTDNTAAAAAGVGEVQRSGFGLAGAYTLSKRTFLYGGMKKVTLDNGTAADTKVTAFGVGVQHNF
jgi:predicted porin